VTRLFQHLASAGCTAVLAGAPALAEPALRIVRGGETVAEFSVEALAALPQATIVTENAFMDGLRRYRGPQVAEVLAPLDPAPDAVLDFLAANDYAVGIPFADVLEFQPILALEIDGEPLSLRDRGPLWLMYPVSERSELQDPLYLGRLIWQVVQIDVRPR
jgi:hypothetical protein